MEAWSPKINILLWALLFVIGSSVLGLGLLLWTLDYDHFATIVLNYVDKPDWQEYFEQEVFPESRFQLLRKIVFFIIGLWLFIIYFYYNNKEKIASQIAVFLVRSQAIIKRQISITERSEQGFLIVIFVLVALRQLYHLHHYELQYDEAWTYNHFISKGFIVSAISPNNNHIFYTLLACLSDYLPLEAKYSLRLPVYLAGFPTLFLFYLMLRSIWGWRLSLVALSWFAFCPSITFYMMYGRAYIFQLLFTILSCWSVLKLGQNTSEKPYYWTVFVVTMVLGFYSVPTQAYVWSSFNMYFLLIGLSGFLNWKYWLFSNVIIIITTAILYFPFLISNGMTTLLAASDSAVYGEPFVAYQDKVSDWLLFGGGRGTPVYWFWGLLLLVLVFLRCKKNYYQDKNAITICLIFLLLPSILNLSLGTQPPFRIWCFLAIFIGIFIPIIGIRIEQRYWAKFSCNALLIVVSVFFVCFNIARAEVHYALQWSVKLDREAKKIAALLLDQKIEECYFFSDYDKPLLECYYLRKKQVLKTAMIATNSKNYAPFVEARLYESVLWDKEDRVATKAEKDWLEQYYPIVFYENQRIEIRLAAL